MKDIENGQAVLCRRDTREKYTVSFEELADNKRASGYHSA